jgi:hypothetical protein
MAVIPAGNRQSGSPATGLPRPGDQTSMPGQVPDQVFGISIGSGNTTGAPGSTGAAGAQAADDTSMPGQDKELISGDTEQSTGAPGSQGGRDTAASGATWTSPFGFLDGGDCGQMAGGSVDTEAQANHYGSNMMPGVAGSGQPKGTGAGSGGVMRGGRAVR